ncbi:MAG: hypothetical protein R3B13_31390 [Polyangiaceae bacterium]
MKARVLLLLWALCLALISSTAGAADRVRVVVGSFDGDHADEIRRAVVEGLKSKGEVLVVRQAHATKVGESLGHGEANASGVKAISGALSLGGWIEGSVKKGGGVWTATLKLRGPSGDVGETHKFRAAKVDALNEKIRSGIWKALGPALQDAPKPKGSGKKRVVVLPFTGSKSGTVRSYAVGALKKAKGTTVVPDKSLRDVALSEEPKSEDITTAAAVLDAALFVGGTVESKKGKYTLNVVAWNGADGEVMAEFSLDGKGLLGLRGAVVKGLPKKLASPLERARVPEPPEEDAETASGTDSGSDATDDAEEDEEEEEEEEEASSPTGRPSPLEIIGGVRAFSRNFRYSDDLFDALRSYKLGAAPAFFVQGRWYPAAHFTGGVPANIGLALGYEQGVFLKSKVSGGDELATKMTEWYAGLRYRVPIEKHEVGVQGTYGKHTFEVDDDPAAPLVPDVGYSYVRFGIDGRIRVDKILLGAQLGYRMLLDTGELQSSAWFPNAGGGGVDAGFMAGYEFITGVALVAGFDFRRYFFSFDPEPGDPYIAGGAVDEYLSGWGGVRIRLPGEE